MDFALITLLHLCELLLAVRQHTPLRNFSELQALHTNESPLLYIDTSSLPSAARDCIHFQRKLVIIQAFTLTSSKTDCSPT